MILSPFTAAMTPSDLPSLLAETPPPGGGAGMLIPFVLMFVIMYFVLIRPQRKRQKELQTQIEALRSGDRIVTIGGMHGLVTNVKERTIILKVADNTKVEFEKSAVQTVVKKKDDGKADAAPESEASDN